MHSKKKCLRTASKRCMIGTGSIREPYIFKIKSTPPKALSFHPSSRFGFYIECANPLRFAWKAPCRLLFFSFALAGAPTPDKPFCRLPARLRDSGIRCISEESPPNILATAHPHNPILYANRYSSTAPIICHRAFLRKATVPDRNR